MSRYTTNAPSARKHPHKDIDTITTNSTNQILLKDTAPPLVQVDNTNSV